VQGSAADLVKSAMTEIDRRLFRAFPHCARPLRPSNRPSASDRRRAESGGAYFALQMHDELLYEVSAGDALQVAKIVKMVMENACRLSVVTPVKVKLGASWGQLKELEGLLN
jgi:DNA polymerase theta